MGGGSVCDNNFVKNLFNNQNTMNPKNNCSDNKNNQKVTQPNGGNVATNNKTYHILSNIIENSPDRKSVRKRYSYFPNYEKTQNVSFTNMQDLGNGIGNYEEKNSPLNKSPFLNQYNYNEEKNKNLNGNSLSPKKNSRLKMNIIKEEDEYNNPENSIKFSNINNVNLISENNSKHNQIIQKIKENEEDRQKNVSNVNYNLGENNFIFINISRKSAIISKNDLERLGSTTPKMIIDKEILEEMSKGNKKLFSHFCKNKVDNKDNNFLKNGKIIKDVFIHSFDMNRYSEEMLNVINSIRLNPKAFIKDIDYILNNNLQKNDEGIFLINRDIEEKIKLMSNYMEMIELSKKMLEQMGDSPEILSKLEKLEYNDDLEIIFDESNYEEIYPEIDIKDLPSKLNLIYEENGIDETVDIDDDSEQNLVQYNENINVIDFDEEDEKEKEKEQLKDKDKDKDNDLENTKNNIKINNNNNINNGNEVVYKKKFGIKKKKNINKVLDLNDDIIANLILQKRKEIKKRYPNIIFKISVIKDIRTSILAQIIMEEFFKEENKKSLKDIIFNPQYKYFSVSWTNEINRNFLSISSFA